VRIVAFGTNEPALLAGCGPLANSLAVNAVAPAAIDLPMALAAELLRLIEIDQVAGVIDEFVTCLGIVTIQAP